MPQPRRLGAFHARRKAIPFPRQLPTGISEGIAEFCKEENITEVEFYQKMLEFSRTNEEARQAIRRSRKNDLRG